MDSEVGDYQPGQRDGAAGLAGEAGGGAVREDALHLRGDEQGRVRAQDAQPVRPRPRVRLQLPRCAAAPVQGVPQHGQRGHRRGDGGQHRAEAAQGHSGDLNNVAESKCTPTLLHMIMINKLTWVLSYFHILWIYG